MVSPTTLRNTPAKVAENVTAAMEAVGASQVATARNSGMTLVTFRRRLAGGGGGFKVHELEAVAKALKVDLVDLLNGSDAAVDA